MSLANRKRIKEQMKLICGYSKCKTASARKKLFLHSSTADQRKLLNAVHNCSKHILAQGKQLQPGFQARVRRHKRIFKKIVNATNYPRRSALLSK